MAFYVIDGLWLDPTPLRLNNPLLWGQVFMLPVLQLTGLLWFSPLPWQWRQGRAAAPPSFRRGLLQAFLFSEGWASALVLLGMGIRHWAGRPAEAPLSLWFYNWSIPGGAMILIGRLMASREQETWEKEEIRAEAEEARARVLQSQLHPHVLFNAMNGLAELVYKDPALAEESIRHISALLRKVLHATEQADFTLGDERALLEDYLHMECIRYSDQLRLSWDWDAALDLLPLPALMLQPLAENAIKHGIGPNEEGGELVIVARREGGRLVLEVRNTGIPLRRDAPDGVGLRNLRSRLDLLYRDTGGFSLISEGTWTVASLRLELEELQSQDGTASSRPGGRRTPGPGTAVSLAQGARVRGAG